MRLFGRALQVTAYRPPAEIGDDAFETMAKANPDLTGREIQQQLNAKRSAAVAAGSPGIIIREHRVQFTVEKTNGSEPNKADITITNLAARSRTEICRKPLTVDIAAGYDGAARHIFTGDLRDGRSIHSGTELDTKLQLGDGDRAYRYGHVNRSYKAGTNVLHVLRDAASGMGLQLPRNIETSKDLRAQFATGMALFGPARDELSRLLAPYGYRWSIQNGQLQILRDEETREDRAWPISVRTGMIGSPEWSTPSKEGETPKLTVVAALYPELTPGGKVEVASEQVNGIFRIEKVTHTGDTHGDEWTTTIEVKA